MFTVMCQRHHLSEEIHSDYRNKFQKMENNITYQEMLQKKDAVVHSGHFEEV